MTQANANPAEVQLNVIAQESLHLGWRALERHMDHVDAGLQLEAYDREMRRGSEAWRSEVEHSQINAHQIVRHPHRAFVELPDVMDDGLDLMRPHKFDRQVLACGPLQGRVHGIDMANVGRDEQLDLAGRSQPAKLEKTIGMPLVERSTLGVVPTEYGRALIAAGNAIFSELRHGIDMIETLAAPATGEPRIGCTEPMAWGIVPEVIQRLIQRYPRYRFQVIHSDPNVLRRRELPERRVDLVIGAVIGDESEDEIACERLCDEQRFVVASRNSPWAHRRALSLADIAGAHWIIPPHDSPARQTLEAAFRLGGLQPPRYAVETFSIPLLATLVGSGTFLTVLPASMLRFSASRFTLKRLPIALPAYRNRINIMTLKGRTASPILKAFATEARLVARALT